MGVKKMNEKQYEQHTQQTISEVYGGRSAIVDRLAGSKLMQLCIFIYPDDHHRPTRSKVWNHSRWLHGKTWRAPVGIFDKPRRYMDNEVVKLIRNALLSLSLSLALVHSKNRLALSVPLYLPANFLV